MSASVVDPDMEVVGDSSGPAESPCLTRLRHKRLLAFLRGQHYDGAFNALLHQAREQFCLERMQLLVTEGLWEDAVEYLNNFLPACPRSFGAQVLHNFVLMHHNIARLVAGHRDALGMIRDDKWMSHATDDVQSENHLVPCGMIRSILFFDNVRKCMNWRGVRRCAAQTLKRLVWLTPELNGRLTLPARHMMPQEVLPVGLGLSRRRCVKNKAPPVKSAAVARVIRGSQHYIRRLKCSSFESFDDAKEYLSTIIDNSLRGGLHTGCYVLKPSGNEGDPTLPIWKVTSCAEISEVTAMANAGDPTRPILKVTGCAENSGVTATVNAGTEKILEGCYTEMENTRLGPRKKQRAEQPILQDFLGMKKQRTAGAFGESSMMLPSLFGVEGHPLAAPRCMITNY